MQKIYLLDIKGFSDEERLKSLLPPYAVKKAEGYAERADRIRSLFGSMLIETFTAKESILLGAHGKPYKKTPPFFNVSHSGDKVGIFLSDNSEVGFDIQLIKDYNAALAARVFPEKEIDIVCAADFTKFWTMKESAAKLTGEGIVNTKRQILTGVVGDTFNFDGKRVYYKTFIKDGYAITACAYGKISAEISEITTKDLIFG